MNKKLILGILILFFTSRVEAQSIELVNKAVISFYGVTAFVDVATTEYGLGKGIVHETNPIQKIFTDKGPVWSGIAKGSMHVGIGYLLIKYHDSSDVRVKRITLVSAIGLSVAQLFVDINNAKAITKN
jgi:hypothetical protein